MLTLAYLIGSLQQYHPLSLSKLESLFARLTTWHSSKPKQD